MQFEHTQSFVIQAVEKAVEILESAPDLSPNHPDIHTVIGMLEGMCKTPVNSEEAKLILSEIERPTFNRLRDLLYLAEIEDEKYHVEQPLTNLTASINSAYGNLVKDELDELLKHIQNKQDLSRAIFVGSGPMPLTTVLLNHYLGTSITAIDNSPECIEIGTNYLKRQGLQEKIVLIDHDGVTFDYSDAGYVYIAGMVNKKMDIFNRIAETNPKALVVTRGGEGLKELFYDRIDIDELEKVGWKCLSYCAPPPGTRIRNNSYVFKYEF